MKLKLQVAGKSARSKDAKRAPLPMSDVPQARTATVRRPAGEPFQPRRDVDSAFAGDSDTEEYLRGHGRRRIRRGLIPQTRTGRIAAAVTSVACLLAVGGGTVLAARFISTDPKFRIPASSAIEIAGNSHLTRSQMLSVFGEDVDRNIFSVPMDQRRAQLEHLPWVEHATVMRLLPNRLRVEVVERVPVAFVREGSRIGLVDANGVLLDIPPDTPGTSGYTFPVVTGVKASETAEERAEQMKLYAAFLKDLDSDGKSTSAQLSEIDLSDPEDARALIPDHNNEVLVHFGHENFLARYKRFQEHIAEWRGQYPRLSSVDMRYERQVVLQMPPKDATVTSAPAERAAEPTPPLHPQVASTIHLPVAGYPQPSPQRLSATADTAAGSPLSATPPKSAAAGKSAKPAISAEDKDAAMRKRVEAIKVWMAQREKARAAAQAKSGTAPGVLNTQ